MLSKLELNERLLREWILNFLKYLFLELDYLTPIWIDQNGVLYICIILLPFQISPVSAMVELSFCMQEVPRSILHCAKKFFLIFISILGLYRFEFWSELALFQQPSTVMTPLYLNAYYQVIYAQLRRSTAEYRKQVKRLLSYSFTMLKK